MHTSTVNRQLVWQFIQRDEPLALARCLRPRPRRHAARARFEYRAPRLLCQPRQHHQPSRRSACGQGNQPRHSGWKLTLGKLREGPRSAMALPSERARPGRGVLSAVFAPAAAPPCDDSAPDRAPACTAPALALRAPGLTRAALQVVALATLGAVGILGAARGRAQRGELVGDDVQRVSAVAGALNVFKSIAAGAPVPTTCWEPPCAPAVVAAAPAAVPHRLAGILTGVKMLEQRLQRFERGERGWRRVMERAAQRAGQTQEVTGTTERAVYRDEEATRHFLSSPGPRGAAGSPGLTGIRGPPGSVGMQGLAGPRGREGAGGSRGRPGAPGPVGASGAVGPMGQQGPLGDEGERGAVGQPGEDGPVGVRGRQGAPAEDGQMGPPGQTLVGLPGPPGPQGKAGPMGIMGAAGVEGSSGLEGHVGLPGGTGVSGLRGWGGGPDGNGRALAKYLEAQARKVRGARTGRGPRKSTAAHRGAGRGQGKGPATSKKGKGAAGKKGAEGVSLQTLASLKRGKAVQNAADATVNAQRKGVRGKSTHACAGGRVANHRIGVCVFVGVASECMLVWRASVGIRCTPVRMVVVRVACT